MYLRVVVGDQSYSHFVYQLSVSVFFVFFFFFYFCFFFILFFFFQAEDGIRDLVRSRGLGDVYKRQLSGSSA